MNLLSFLKNKVSLDYPGFNKLLQHKMLRPEIDWESCQPCNPCEARLVCKTRAIVKFDPEEPAFIEQARCNSCGLCILACVCGAIIMRNTSIANTSPDGCLPFR